MQIFIRLLDIPCEVLLIKRDCFETGKLVWSSVTNFNTWYWNCHEDCVVGGVACTVKVNNIYKWAGRIRLEPHDQFLAVTVVRPTVFYQTIHSVSIFTTINPTVTCPYFGWCFTTWSTQKRRKLEIKKQYRSNCYLEEKYFDCKSATMCNIELYHRLRWSCESHPGYLTWSTWEQSAGHW